MVPSTMDSPIWGMMMSVGMISFHPSPQFEARAGRKQSIIYKRALEAGTRGGGWAVGNGPRKSGEGGGLGAGPGRARGEEKIWGSDIFFFFFSFPSSFFF